MRGGRPSYALLLLLLVVGLLKNGPAQDRDPDAVTVSVPGAKIDVTLPGESMKLTHQELLGWVRASANAVSTYYGRFPVPHLTLRIRSTSGSGIRHGVTYAKDGGLILISVGRDAGIDDTKDDWVLVHEMIHLAFPSMPDDQHWLEEGISTYVEPVARVRVGLMSLDELWRTFVRDMPKGEPAAGDEGLDNTHTWGRTYWGGAMFCLLADVRIRERTGDRKSLQDALRGILNGGGNITQDWEIEKTLALGDKATGTDVLRSLYREMRDKPAPADLDALWKRLGVELKERAVTFDDRAPEANIRKAMAVPASPSSSGSHQTN
jgi:hypothetical protein